MSIFSLSRSRVALTGVSIFAVGGLLLSGCSSSDSTDQHKHSTSQEQQHSGAQLQDAWVKAATTGKLTAVFGVLTNNSTSDIQIESVTTQATDRIEFHETVIENGTSKMRSLEHGFRIPAHKETLLEPGGNHIMLMDLQQDLLAGDRLDLTLRFSDGSEQTVSAEIRDFSGAEENYEDHEHMHDHGNHDQDNHGHEHHDQSEHHHHHG